MQTGLDKRNNRSKAELKKLEKDYKESPQFKQVQKMLKNVSDTAKPLLDQIKASEKQDYSWIGVVSGAIHSATNKRFIATEIALTYDPADAALTRIIDARLYTCNLTKNSKREKLLRVLNTRKTFIQRTELQDLLDCPSADAISTMVKSFNIHTTNKLSLKKLKLIEGKRGSGYRINPNIRIERN